MHHAIQAAFGRLFCGRIMANEIQIRGLDTLLDRLRALPEDVARRGMRLSLRKGGNVIRDLARARAARIDDPTTQENIALNIVTLNYPKSAEASMGGPAARVGVLGGAKQYSNTRFNRRKRRVGATYGTGGSSSNPGGDTWYWRFLEFGTSKMRARPFMRPAMNVGAAKALQTVADQMNKAVDRAVKRKR